MRELHCVLDLETFGTADDAIIVTAGAVIIDANATDDSASASMYARIDIEEQVRMGRSYTLDTMRFWLGQEPAAVDALSDPNVELLSPAEFVERMFYFITTHDIAGFWGKSFQFDWGKIFSLDEAVSEPSDMSRIRSEIPFYKERDVRTLESAMGKTHRVPMRGTKHCALDDAMHEARCIRTWLQACRQMPKVAS